MARIADFVAVQDHGSTIPHPQTGINDVHFPPFDAPDVSGAPAILAFRVESHGDVVLTGSLNGRLLSEQPLKTSPVRSWHEVISTTGIVQATGNNLTLAVRGRGSVTVSDVVLHFQAWAPTHPTPFIAAQNTRYSQPLSCGVHTGVIVISGRYFLQVGIPGTPDLDSFVKKTLAEVQERLEERYLADHPEIPRATTEILMIDIEDPHPRDLHEHPNELADIVDAYKTRIAALKEVFRQAKVCMYGTLNPDGRGRPDNAQYLARLTALKTAGQVGLFDQLDYLVPVLYPRFGPNDPPKAWKSYRAYTEQGIDGTRQLLRSDDTSLPVLPVTGFRIANHPEHTAHSQELLLDLPISDPLRSTLGVQLEVMAEKGVRQVAFWVGKDSDVLDEPNPNARTVTPTRVWTVTTPHQPALSPRRARVPSPMCTATSQCSPRQWTLSAPAPTYATTCRPASSAPASRVRFGRDVRCETSAWPGCTFASFDERDSESASRRRVTSQAAAGGSLRV